MRKKTIADDERVQRFVEVAKRFCRLIEKRSKVKKRDFIHQCAELLSELQLRFLQLLPVKTRFVPFSRSDWSDPYSTIDRWKKLERGLSRKLGKDNGYHFVFDPYIVEDDDPIYSSLADDLADIYSDIRSGLSLLGQGDAKDDHDAVWVWQFLFRAHTGHHCVSALCPLQILIERYHEDD